MQQCKCITIKTNYQSKKLKRLLVQLILNISLAAIGLVGKFPEFFGVSVSVLQSHLLGQLMRLWKFTAFGFCCNWIV